MTVRTIPRPPLTARMRARPRNRWAPRVLGAVAAAMVPWVFVLGRSLPATTQVRHWPAVWIGLDLAMALGCAITARLVHHGDDRARLSASAVAALMVMDAWFDVLTAQAGTEVTQALVCAVPELALAGLCTWLALHDTERPS
ncbi:hypothetical protein [Amycolatopsis sp. RTGN1]|uniref:hypothetical protein n=1 Tax=Amycolatopsis ponsaeliensis TaxID=2992142 RepID=UPI00254E59B5|nr:hypothetical protein [Amycolatopsis sp. RTGN1]